MVPTRRDETSSGGWRELTATDFAEGLALAVADAKQRNPGIAGS